MSKLTKQQQAIVDAPLEPMAVVACAGSGKTKTAVQRVSTIREKIEPSRSHVALLSFSNVAVTTFRQAYAAGSPKSRVTIDTFDSFLTNNILRPHAYRTMGCERCPFLLTGSEPFLQNKKFKYWYEPSPGTKRCVEGADINNIVINFDDDGVNFCYRDGDTSYVTNNGYEVTEQLASLGAYTHELGKFWSLLTLVKQPEVLRVFANRYPHIIVDEAQDVGELHQLILNLLSEQGVKVILVGDPNQAIYEFAGATGEFLTEFDEQNEKNSYALTLNFRSIPAILNLANSISGRTDRAIRKPLSVDHGAFYTTYETNKHKQVIELFEKKLKESKLSIANSAVLYRNNSGKEKLLASSKNVGQGKVKLLALAAIQRDKSADFRKAFSLVSRCIVGLLTNVPENLAAMIISSSNYTEVKEIRLDIWRFVRSVDEGLPSATLNGSTIWHESLKQRLLKLLDKIEQKYGYCKVDNLGRKLAKTRLADEPLILDPEVRIDKQPSIRVDTVHQAKGESLDGVLYIASKAHIDAMLAGVHTEVGRIGYVAVTRAKDLFILGVPKNALAKLEPKLKAIGLKKLES